jgi:hypothetical protein
MGAFDEALAAIWKGHDPYAGFPLDAWPAEPALPGGRDPHRSDDRQPDARPGRLCPGD